jgi:hypothetical protein
VSYQVFYDSNPEPVVFETAAEALAALTPETTSIWLINPQTKNADRSLMHSELKCFAEQEAAAPDPEEVP